jgi:hypothetical protein
MYPAHSHISRAHRIYPALLASILHTGVYDVNSHLSCAHRIYPARLAPMYPALILSTHTYPAHIASILSTHTYPAPIASIPHTSHICILHICVYPALPCSSIYPADLQSIEGGKDLYYFLQAAKKGSEALLSMGDANVLTRVGQFYGVFKNGDGIVKSKDDVTALKAEWDKIQQRSSHSFFIGKVMIDPALQTAVGVFFGRHLSRNANAALQQLPGIPNRILEAMALGHAAPPSAASAASAAMTASWITSAPQFVPFPPGMPFTLACILHPHFHPMPSHKQSRTPTSIPHRSFYLTLSNLSRTPGVSRTLATIPLLIVYLAFSHISRTCVSILSSEH